MIWERSADPSRPYAAYELTPGPPPQKVKLDRDALKNLQASKVPIVYSGDIPRGEAWQEFIAKQSTTTIIHEPTSANKDLHSIAEATALGKRPLSQNTKVFNALPQESDPAASHQERIHMGLQNTGTVEAWKSLNESIRPEVEGFDHPFAAKKAILDELSTGTSDVVLIYAHFDGERLHLPFRHTESSGRAGPLVPDHHQFRWLFRSGSSPSAVRFDTSPGMRTSTGSPAWSSASAHSLPHCTNPGKRQIHDSPCTRGWAMRWSAEQADDFMVRPEGFEPPAY